MVKFIRMFTSFCFFFLSVLTKTAFCQNHLTVNIANSQGQSIEYANILIKAQNDSSIIYSGITDSLGLCSLNIPTNSDLPIFLEINCFGYETYRETICKSKNINIVLHESSIDLDAAYITADRKLIEKTGNSVIVNIQNSTFANQDKIKDVLKYLPYVSMIGNSISIAGDGSPLIYVDGHKVRNEQYLGSLPAKDIKYIEIISSPGAEYNSSTRGVLKIATKKKDDGFSGNLTGSLFDLNGRISEVASSNLNYRAGKWDLFDIVNFNDMRIKGNSNSIYKILTPNLLQQTTSANENNDRLFFQNEIGFDYNNDDKLNFGAKYVFYRKTKDYIDYISKSKIIDEQGSELMINTDKVSDRNFSQHQIDAYLNYSLTETCSLSIDANYDIGREKSSQTIIQNDAFGPQSFESTGEYDYHFFATKAAITHSFSFGEVYYGFEFTNTSYNTFSNNELPLYSKKLLEQHNKRKENNAAGFAGADFRWEKIQLSAGLRYENASINYELLDVVPDKVEYSDRYFFPNFSATSSLGQVNFGVAYSSKISRPRYYDLRNSIEYSSPIVYLSGNPSLKASLIHSFSVDFTYKGFYSSLSYEFQKDPIISAIQRYDNTSLIITPANIPKAQFLSAYFYWTKQIKQWEPIVSLNITKPFVCVSETYYNKISTQISLQNILSFGKGWQAYFNATFNLGGHEGILLYKPYFDISSGISKSFEDNKMQITLYYTDIFNLNIEKYEINSKQFYVSNERRNGMNRGLSLSISYNINPMSQRYKGTKAGSTEKVRL